MLDRQFQKAIMRFFITDMNFYNSYSAYLTEEYFDTDLMKILFTVSRNYILKYEKSIPLQILSKEIDFFIESKALGSDLKDSVKQELINCMKSELNSKEYVEDKLLDFIKQQRIVSALNESVQLLGNSQVNYQKIVDMVNLAVEVDPMDDVGFTFKDVLNIPELYQQKYNPDKLIQTGLNGFDDILGGGLAPGEVHLVFAKAKTGKSSFGAQVGCNNLIKSKTVFHITLEIEKTEVASMYGSNLSGISRNDLAKTDPKIYSELVRKNMGINPKLYIKYYTQNTVTTLDIRSYINRVRNKTGDNPDLIIVDYDDLLNPIDSKTSRDKYDKGAEIYKNLKQLAEYFKVPILTFSQSNRWGWDALSEGDLLSSKHIATSSQKVNIVHSLSTLNFKDDKEVTGTLYAELVRRGISGQKLIISRDLAHSRFYEGTNITISNKDENLNGEFIL